MSTKAIESPMCEMHRKAARGARFCGVSALGLVKIKRVH